VKLYDFGLIFLVAIAAAAIAAVVLTQVQH